MRTRDFDKLRKACPWHYKGTNFGRPSYCRAVDKGPSRDITVKENSAIPCCKKNCAVLYWLEMKK